MEIDVMEDEKPAKKKKIDRKHNLKGLDELGRKQLKRRTDEVYKTICDLAKEENASVVRLLCFLLTRSPENADIREIGQDIWNKTGHFQDKKVVPIESCLVEYNDCKLGWQTYTKQKEISPVVKHLPAPFTGIFFPLSEAVEMTISRLLDGICDNLTTELCFNIKFGFDGSGSHFIFHQKNSAQTNNIIMSMFCPLEMKTEAGSSLWVQPSPNSLYTHWPVSLQMGKESEESLQSLKLFNDDISKMKNDCITVKKGDDSYKVKVKKILHMMDMKAANLYLGLGGAYCDLCTCSKDQCLDPERIKVDLTNNREVED